MTATDSPPDAGSLDATALAARVEEFLAAHDPSTTEPGEFLRERFAAGLAWVHYPAGLGGLGAENGLQAAVDAAFAAAGSPENRPRLNVIGLGMAAPTIVRFGDDAQKERWLPSLWTGEDIWCQLFSEPGAGSDLAGVGTSAVWDGDAWVLNGQKVWTSMAHHARWGILLARTDPEAVKHRGLSYFVVDMTAPGVEVRGLRQITGEAEFNEVFLTDVRVPDDQRLGEVGQGWAVAQYTLMNERVAIGGGTLPRESGAVGSLAARWREHPEAHTPGLHDRMLRLWVEAEAARLTAERLGQQQAAGQPGPEGSGVKITYARLNQECSSLELELRGEDGLRYADYTERRPEVEDYASRDAGWRYLRFRANSIEGGTSEILRNVIAERVLGLPAEARADKDVPWKDLPR
ncbi:acyl-CoA dehydrogenase family protein [Actinomycetospora sp. NBC_00405]|uniref:acyl-CoA dehydrogenase family protein n=1 Tax=Actinomycetospora sp. NBC_00405 TaxID=2975952 RepID=UPI002E22D5E1